MMFQIKKTEYVGNANRIEEERTFSLAKRYYGRGMIKTKLDSTTRISIALHSDNVVFRFKQYVNMLIFMSNKGCEKLDTCWADINYTMYGF